MEKIKEGTLYLVGTPIGNLEDFSLRGARILADVDFICAEDTRVSAKLLRHLGLKKSLVSCHQHSSAHVFEQIADRLARGESCAVVTDAGMPCISDPGEELVRLCVQRKIPVCPIPGPTALATALAVSGLPTGRFVFEGFLPVEKKERRQRLEAVQTECRTIIFYEAPHKLLQCLTDLLEALGDRPLTVCRELTKIYEEIRYTTLSEALAFYQGKSGSQAVAPRGEFVLVVGGGSPKMQKTAVSLEEAVRQAQALIEAGMKQTDACREIARTTGFKKSEIYTLLL